MFRSRISSYRNRLAVGLLTLALVAIGFGPVSAGSIQSGTVQAVSEPQALKTAVDLPIYADALAGDWQDWSWDTTVNLNNTDPVHSGSASFSVTYTKKWGGLLLHADPALPAGNYTAIRFWVHGGSTGGQPVNLHVNDSGVMYPFTAQANTWVQVTVPLADLGNPTTLSDLFWQDGSGNDLGQPTYYLDDISLIGRPPGTWTVVTSPVSYPLRSVAMLSTNDGWAVGYEGSWPNGNLRGSVMLRWNANTWNAWGSDSSGPALFSVTTVSSSDGWAVGSNSGNGSAIQRWNGSAWNSVPPPGGYTLRSVSMASADDGWAVGGGGNCIQGSRLYGTIMRWDGSAWSAGSTILDRVINSVAMVSASDGWAVGNYCYAYWDNSGGFPIPHWDNDSLILRWNGSSWNEVGSPTFYSLTSVAMVSATDGWAVGVAGTIQHWNGSAWSWIGSPTSCNLTSVSMVSADDGWAVGGGGAACPSQPSVILHWGGKAWSEMASPVSQTLNSVTMISANEGWAVGEAGTILHYTNFNNLNVIKTGTGSGTVISNPAGIDCGATCSASFGKDTSVTLTATAASGSQFTGWSGSECSGTGTCTVSMDAAKSVTAEFTQLCYVLTLAHTGSGNDPTALPTNSSSCSSGQYHAGESISLSASPVAGWAVGSWNGTDHDASTSMTNSVIMPSSDRTVTANYIQPCYTLTMAHTGSGSDPTASPTNSSGCSSGQYHAGESISLTANPTVGWAVGSWVGTNNDASTSTTNSLTMPSSSRTVTANYTLNTYRIYLPLVIR